MNRILHTLRASLALTRGAPKPPSLAPGVDPTDPDGEAGMATAEYAIGTLAAAAFAGLLLAIMRGGGPTALLSSLINSALSNP
ncbi:Uncharacterised protein [Actinomyces bovis]|uniref:DUF4244 domain-containing protein n=1 Tax=Actinomyces bovis TaxID=1658 RepID=A0ABY1VRS1_9ACTO|nr:DUF4244 domain-containing protein [Actinomyces bovis]SPT55065.1 Uncharacterised protein [Actinomyces bovis]VEG56244.1 Uncharacterised protein [Actinomyces israelii]